MINFPASPTINQTVTFGVKTWKHVGGGVWDLMTISDAQVVRAETAAANAAASAATIGTTAAFSDANPVVKGSADATKQLRFEVDGFTTGTTRTLTVPNKNGLLLTDGDVDPTRSLYSQANATNTFDYRVAGTQRWTPGTSGPQTLSITNWQVAPQKGELILDVINGGAATLAFPAGSVFVTAGGLEVSSFASSGIVFPTSGRRRLLVWSYDAGATTYFKAA